MPDFKQLNLSPQVREGVTQKTDRAFERMSKSGEHLQINLPSEAQDLANRLLQDFELKRPNVLRTAKEIISDNKVKGKRMEGPYLIRGANTTGYSTVTVFDPSLGGFCQIRTHIDVGDASITTNSPGENGQELYLKVDNDTD
jgi:hypothetical protein